MTDTSALRALRDKVKDGTFLMDVMPPGREMMAYSAFSGSLDAAKALHEAVLPGWVMESFHLHGEVVIKRRRPLDTAYGYADGNPARAWLLALLDALIQEAGE